MSIIDQIIEKAKSNKKTIVLPEGFDQRVLQAATRAAQEGIARIVLVGNRSDIEKQLSGFSSENLLVVDPDSSSQTQKYAELLFERRKHKGMTPKEADALARDTLFFGAAMVAAGDADGMVTGAATASADVLRAAIQVVGCKSGVPVASSCQIMDMSANPFLDARAWALADCVVNINPTAEQLAVIAVKSAETFEQLTGIEPKVALLSFSTKGSAKHAFVDKVAEAARLAQQIAPGLQLDGELQLDAAIIGSVGQKKCPGSPVAGQANVLIFPDIQSGNIGYKLIERVGGGKFVGCAIQGLTRPVNDMSRGCNAEDLFNTVAMSAVQAQSNI